MADVFICYSRKDKEFAAKLRDGLAGHDRVVWIDFTEIPPTVEWWKEICTNIDAADNFMFVISPDSCSSEVCREEVAHADGNHKRLIPVVYRTVDYRDLPAAIARIQWIPFADLAFDIALKTLILALDTDIDWVRSHTRLLVRAREWDVSGRDPSSLLRGMDLQKAVEWIAHASIKEPKAAALQEEYVRASQEWEAGEIQRLKELNDEKERQRRRAVTRQRLAVGLLLATVALTVGAWLERNAALRQSQIAFCRENVTNAMANIDLDPELSLLLSIHAVNTTWSADRTVLPEAEVSIRRALLASRIRATLSGHTERVNSVAWRPDGTMLATASSDKTVKIWDVTTGQVLITLSGHTEAVSCAAWSPDGRMLATASSDDTGKVWNAISGQLLVTLQGHSGAVTSVVWNPDGNQLATASVDGVVMVWSVPTGRKILTISPNEDQLDDYVPALAWSPDGKRLAIGGHWTGTIWDARTWKRVFTLAENENPAISLAWSPDSKRLVTGGTADAKVWDALTGRRVLTFASPRGGLVMSVSWSPDGNKVATGSQDGTAKVWDARTGRELNVVPAHHAEVSGIAWSPDGRRFATGSTDDTARVWEALGEEILTLPRSSTSISWSPDGEHLATASIGGAASIWDAKTGRELVQLSPSQDQGQDIITVDLAWSPDGKRIAMWGSRMVAGVWDTKTGHELVAIPVEPGGIDNIVWSQDGTQLATEEPMAKDLEVKVWDAASGKQMRGQLPDEGRRLDVKWCFDAKRLRARSSGDIVKVWDWVTGAELLSLRGHDAGIEDAEFSKDGKRLATLSDDNSVEVWDTTSGRKQFGLFGVENGVSGIFWSPDGKRLATGGETASVWDATTGRRLLTIPNNQSRDGFGSLWWSPDGKRLAAGSGTVYAIDFDLLMSLAHSRVTRNLTPEESQKYLHLDHVPPIPFLASGPR